MIETKKGPTECRGSRIIKARLQLMKHRCMIVKLGQLGEVRRPTWRPLRKSSEKMDQLRHMRSTLSTCRRSPSCVMRLSHALYVSCNHATAFQQSLNPEQLGSKGHAVGRADRSCSRITLNRACCTLLWCLSHVSESAWLVSLIPRSKYTEQA